MLGEPSRVLPLHCLEIDRFISPQNRLHFTFKIVFTSLLSLQPNFFNTLSQLNVPSGYYESKPTLSTTTQNACSFSFFFFLLHFSLPSIPHLFTIIFCFGLSSSLECELHKSFCSLLYPHSLGGKKVH